MDNLKLSQKRNWFKFRLTGITFNYESDSLTDDEKASLKIIKNKINDLLSNLSANNIKLGLKK